MSGPVEVVLVSPADGEAVDGDAPDPNEFAGFVAPRCGGFVILCKIANVSSHRLISLRRPQPPPHGMGSHAEDGSDAAARIFPRLQDDTRYNLPQ